MEKALSALALTVASVAAIALPVTGYAYLSPQQVFEGNQVSTPQVPDVGTMPAPITQREGDAVAASRSAAAIQRLADQRVSAAPLDPTPQDTYVPPTSKAPNLLDENVQYNLRMQRIAEQKANGGPTIVVAGNGTVVDSKGNVLHSGAPLVTSTGPGTFLGLIAMVLAAVCTFGYASFSARRFARTAP